MLIASVFEIMGHTSSITEVLLRSIPRIKGELLMAWAHLVRLVPQSNDKIRGTFITYPSSKMRPTLGVRELPVSHL